VNLKEPQVTIILLGIIFLSSLLNHRQSEVPEHYIQIIDDDEILKYSNNYNTIDSLDENIVADTTYKLTSNRTNTLNGKTWMKKYSYGIIFKFNP